MILEEKIEINLAADLIPYFENLGYEIPRYKPKKGKPRVKRGTKLLVNVSDLPRGSGVIITSICDKCGRQKKIMYKDYIKYVHDGKYYCNSCNYENIQRVWNEKYGGHPMHTQEVKERAKQTRLEKYGVEYLFQDEDFKEKVKKTMMDRYHVPYPMQSNEIREKAIKTNIKKYGVPYPALSEDVKKKTRQTNLEKYGVPYTVQSSEIKEKSKKTTLEKYGYEYAGQVPELREKQIATLYSHGSQKTSSQQLYLYNLFGGELNYPFERFSLDIYKPEDNIAIEVDFGGHDLMVKTGKITQEEFNKREMIREKTIRSNGIRLIRLISPHDKLPSDDKLYEIYNFSKKYFESGHTWIYFYFEENKYINSEHQNESGAFYDFGKLWNVKTLSKKKEVNDVA